MQQAELLENMMDLFYRIENYLTEDKEDIVADKVKKIRETLYQHEIITIDDLKQAAKAYGEKKG